MSKIEDAIRAVRDGSSLYWAFWEPEGVSGADIVEVRLNVTASDSETLVLPLVWARFNGRQSGALYLRRCQPLDREAVEQMLVEILTFASDNVLGWEAAAGKGQQVSLRRA